MSKIYQMSFKIAGEVNGTFKTAFSRSSDAMKKLREESKKGKTELSRLKKAFKEGSLGADEFAQSEKRLQQAIERADDKIRRHAANAKLLKNAYNGVSTVAKTGVGIAGDATRIAAYSATGAAAYTVGKSASKAMDYEAQLSSVKAIGGLDDGQMKQVDKLALETGAATKYSALEAAQGMEELIKAGVQVPDIMNGALLDSLNLATAGNLDLAEAAAIMSTSLNAFKSDGMSSGEAANYLAGTANTAATTVSELQMGLAQVSAVASSVGLSLKDTNIAMGLFANNGLKGSDAGTSLKTMLMRLVPQGKAATDQFRELGLLTKDGTSAFYDANGELKDLSDISGLLQKSMEGLNSEQRMQAMTTMFGSDAIRAANILFKEGSKGADDFAKSMSKIKVADVAAEKMKNAKGALEQLRGAWETTQITVGKSFLPSVEKGANALGRILENNQTKIEEASKGIEKSLLKIIEPLTYSVKPVYNIEKSKKYQSYDKVYREEMEKYNQFNGMDFADKFIFVLDTALDELDAYMGGNGGEKMNKIFTHMAEIGMRSFTSTLGNLAKGSIEEAFSGNFMAAAGLALGANMMTRGLLGKAAGGLLKTGGKKIGGKFTDFVDKKNNKFKADEADKPDKKKPKNPKTDVPDVNKPDNKKPKKPKVNVPEDKPVAKNKPQIKRTETNLKAKADNLKSKIDAKKIEVPEKELKQTNNIAKAGKAVGKLGAVGKVVGKAAAPLAVLGSVATIATAENKKEAIAKEGGSLVGLAGGAKLGAVIGTAIAPGIGTAIGGFAGGALGSVVGSGVGGKIVDGFDTAKEKAGAFFKFIGDSFKEKEPTSTKAQADKTQPKQLEESTTVIQKATVDSESKLKSETHTTSGKFKSLQKNLGTLSGTITSATNSLTGINGIGQASQNVINALNNYAVRINSAQVEGTKTSVMKKTSSLLPERRTKF